MRYQYDYTDPKLTLETQTLIELADTVIEDISGQGYTLTLRQLYYQLVAGGHIENSDRMYKRVGTAVVKGRMLGLLDWDALEDRNRLPTLWSTHESAEDAVEEALDFFRLDRWRDQETYLEVWVEKDALSEIVRNVAMRYQAPVMVNRGYSSVSAMRAAALRFEEKIVDAKECHLLYLGDHDPSGLDMIRDIGDRLEKFEVYDVRIRHIALTTDQVAQYDPPPNPAKEKDSRAASYIERHGYDSWEVDALAPATLTELIEEGIRPFIEWDSWKAVGKEQQEQTDKVREAVKEALSE